MQTVALYLRISEDRNGEGVAVDRQRSESIALIERLGLGTVTEYVDNDISATSGKVRPGFEALLQARPDVIVAWAQDRLLRLTRDLERVIELGVPVYTVVSGTLDLSTPAGRAVARTVAAWSQFEGEQKAERQRAKNRQQLASGTPLVGGKRRFGYEFDHQTPRESEAAWVRLAYERAEQGKSLYSIAAHLNEQGVTGAYGHKWDGAKVHKLLTNPRNIGVLTHRGEVQGSSGITPLVSVEQFDSVQAILNDPARAPRRGPVVRVGLLNNIARCECGAAVKTSASRANGRTSFLYRCNVAGAGHAYVLRSVADAAVIEELFDGLKEQRFKLGDSNEQSDLRRITAELAGLEEDRAAATDALLERGVDKARVRARLDEIETLAQDLAQQRDVLLAANVGTRALTALADLLSVVPAQFEGWRDWPYEDLAGDVQPLGEKVAAMFEELELDERRAIVRSLFDVTIYPARSAERVSVVAR